ncbi:virulence factor Mce family protein [Aeromicrobium marinum DSM 15272]|uniref:Virulence factor Mce family protein n=1 Tax=Aeromicrobium marinum DSM 15272 TaxID=585531 RepID=E2SCQ8_9ACTN|nr:MCE family protein [Aeromicrobium marinum]EFQ83011.1 virulence factor Mce family protein [Aeromicrobium marinum DSM 15272]
MKRLLPALLLPIALLSGCVGPDSTTLTVQFTDATGLFRGNDVGVRGVGVGEVVSITPAGGHVEVEIRVDGDVPLPADVSALIVARSVATDRYVELTPAYSGGPKIGDGDTVPLDRTRTPVEFEEILGSVEQVSSAMSGQGGEAGPLNRILSATAATLDGQGGLIAQSMGDLATLLSAVEGSMGDVEQNLAGLDELTAALADNDALVRRFTTEVTDATTMLAGQRDAIGATFDALAAMVREVAEFSRDHREQVSGQIDDFVVLAQGLMDQQDDLARLLENGPLLNQNLGGAIDERGRLTFLVRVLDLIPGEAALGILCGQLGPICDTLDLQSLPLFDLLQIIQGVRTP